MSRKVAPVVRDAELLVENHYLRDKLSDTTKALRDAQRQLEKVRQSPRPVKRRIWLKRR